MDAFTVDLESFVSCFAATGKASASAARTVITKFFPRRDILFLLGVIRPLHALRRGGFRTGSTRLKCFAKKVYSHATKLPPYRGRTLFSRKRTPRVSTVHNNVATSENSDKLAVRYARTIRVGCAGAYLLFEDVSFCAAAGQRPLRNSSIEEKTSSGLSSHGKCAAPSTDTTRASARVFAPSLPLPYGALRSFVPWIVSTGMVTLARPSSRMRSRSIDPILASK